MTRVRPGALVATLAAVAVVARLPFLRAPLGADEGGFLVVAGQWHAGGGSLYGAYWVDRPPLLLALFALADALPGPLGGEVGLRLLGCVAAAVTVWLAGRVGRQVGGPRAAAWCAALAAGLVVTPAFGAQEVSGELLAIPFVLAGASAYVAALDRPPGGHRLRLLLLAGAAGAAAFLVKQSFADVAVLVVVSTLVGRTGWRSALREVLTVLAGAVAVTSAALGVAALRGTTPAGLWEAVVLFRFQAARVIATSASPATGERLARYPGVLVLSGAVVTIAVLVVRLVLSRRVLRDEPLLLGATAMLVWEGAASLAGGSYWLHYLLGLVPGLVLATALAVPGPLRTARVARVARLASGWALACGLVLAGAQVVHPPAPGPSEVAGAWLARHRDPGDGVVVAFGQADVLAETGASSPYAELWSLPVRVRDPHLRELRSVLLGPHAPAWVVTEGGSLATWGVTPGRAQAVLDREYRPVGQVCGLTVYLRDGLRRPARGPGPEPGCTAGTVRSVAGLPAYA